MIADPNHVIKCDCEVCGKSTVNEYIGVSWNGKYHCIECFELISGRKAFLRCLN